MTSPLIQVAAGPIPAYLSAPLAKNQSFVNLSLVGMTNGAYAGGAGYAIVISAANAPYIAFALGEFASGNSGLNGAFSQSATPGIYTPIVTPNTTDGLISANVRLGAALLLPDAATPAGSSPCSIATNQQPVYTTDGQSGLCFLGPTGPAAALTAGYVLAGKQQAYNQDGDNRIDVLTQPWLNSGPGASVSGVIVATASASSIVLAGAQVGDQVIVATDLTTPGDSRAGFETVITVAGHIQQIVVSGNAGLTTADKVQVLLQRGAL